MNKNNICKERNIKKICSKWGESSRQCQKIKRKCK